MINNEVIIKKVYKLTLEELNKAYEEVKKLGESSQRTNVKAVVARDPLTIHNLNILYSDQKETFPIVFTLDFVFDYDIGTKGRWVIDTTVNEIEVIDIDEN